MDIPWQVYTTLRTYCFFTHNILELSCTGICLLEIDLHDCPADVTNNYNVVMNEHLDWVRKCRGDVLEVLEQMSEEAYKDSKRSVPE